MKASMKILLVIQVFVFLFLIQHNSFAQESSGSRFGIQGSYGITGYSPWGSDGIPSYKGRYFIDLGFLYLKPLSDKWEFETGLVFIINQFRVRPNFFPGPNSTYNASIYQLIIPSNFRLFLAHKFFLQAGPNFTVVSSEPSGLFRPGFSLGFGKEFNLGDKYSLLIAPTFNANPFFPTNEDKMMQLGIRSIFAFPSKK